MAALQRAKPLLDALQTVAALVRLPMLVLPSGQSDRAAAMRTTADRLRCEHPQHGWWLPNSMARMRASWADDLEVRWNPITQRHMCSRCLEEWSDREVARKR